MTPAAFATFVRKRTHTNSITFTDTDMLAFIAARFDYLAARIIQADMDYFGVPETTDIINNNREYPLGSDVLNRVKAVELLVQPNLTPQGWIRLLPFDLSKYNRTTDEATIIANFSNVQDAAFFDVFRDSLWIYSGTLSGYTTGNGGIKIWTYQWPSPPTSLSDSVNDMSIPPSSTQVSLPRNFHYALSLLVQIDYKESFDKPIPLTQQEQNVEAEISKAISQIVPLATEDSPSGQLPDRNHQWNNGFDL